MHYILNEEGEPVLCDDILIWGKWIETHNRTLASTLVDDAAPRLCVSTVFLGTDHNFSGHGPPVLWETMIFPSEEAPVVKDVDYQERYTSSAAALKGHRRAVAVASRILQELDAKGAPPP